MLFVSLDTLRFDRVGAFGSQAGLTPNLDAIAQQSYVFPRAYTNAFYTTPSHMTVFTSLYPNRHQVMGKSVKLPRTQRSPVVVQHLSSQYKTLAELLSERGYRTFWSSAARFKFLDFDLGFGRGVQQKIAPVFQRPFPLPPQNKPLSFNPSPLISVLNDKEPFFGFVHSYISHSPYTLTPPPQQSLIPFEAHKLLSSLLDNLRQNPLLYLRDYENGISSEWTPESIGLCSDPSRTAECVKNYVARANFLNAIGAWQHSWARQVLNTAKDDEFAQELGFYQQAYDQSVAALDRQVGEFWSLLESQGKLKNTLVVFFSDHGEELFEHRNFSHSAFYEHTAHIPLIIYHPEVKKPLAINDLVSLVDVLPIVMNILGAPVPPQAQGRGLMNINEAQPVFGFALGNDFVFDGHWKLQRFYDGKEELFYLPLDPDERENLIDLDATHAQQAYLRLAQARARWELEQQL